MLASIRKQHCALTVVPNHATTMSGEVHRLNEPTPEQPEWMRDAMAAKSRGRALGGRIDKLMWAGDVAALDQAFAWAKGNVSPDMALGLLVFTLPVRTKLAHRPAFLEWARTVLTVDDLDGVE